MQKTLIEAAADMLAQSKRNAPAMPLEKVKGEVDDLGGPTPQNFKSTDDSSKIDASKGVKKQAEAPKTKPSGASGDTQLNMASANKPVKEEEFDESAEQIDEWFKSYYDPKHPDSFSEKEYHTTHQGLHGYPLKSPIHQHSTNYLKKALHAHQNVYDSEGERADPNYWEDSKGEKDHGAMSAHIHAKKAIHNIKRELTRRNSGNKVSESAEQNNEDISNIFIGEENLSEEFKQRVATIFEARVNDRISSLKEELETTYASQLEEAVAQINTELTDKVNDYLDYVVEQWMEENEVAIESGLRSELVDDFIGGLRNLFAEHYIDVPEDKVDLVDELAGKVEELEASLNEEIQRGMEYKKQLVESKKAEVLHVVCDGLTDVQAEKIKSLAESVEFSTEEEYTEKLETIRENYFPSGVKKATEAALNEQVEDEGKQVIADPVMKAYAETIRKTIPR